MTDEHSSSPVRDDLAQDDEKTVELLQKLRVILSTTADLVKNLKEIIDNIDKIDSNEKTEEKTDNIPRQARIKPPGCTCPNTCGYMLNKNGKTEDSLSSSKQIKTQNDVPINDQLPSIPINNTLNATMEQQNEKNKVVEVPVKDTVGAGESKGDAVLEIGNDLKPKKVLPDSNLSTDTLITEPKYDTDNKSSTNDTNIDEDCGCNTKEAKPKSQVKDTKSQTKAKNRKQMVDKLAKEKTEKMLKLKEGILITQKNLADIQEQVRQLERLSQDYDTMNTPEGQVNSAALYKEIMKPQTVPYVNFTKKSTLLTQVTTECACNPTVASERSQIHRKNQEKVSVLSAVPLEEAFL